jgi:hypothetical protein
MKKLLMLAVAMFLACSTSALAQGSCSKGGASSGPSMHDMGKSADNSAPLKTLKGTVSQDGDKIMFTSDADHKTWEVVNPETLKDHVGHHVQLRAHVYADKNNIHVMNVKMLKEKEKSAM